MYCPSCGTVAEPKAKMQGSLGISILLLLVFFPAAIAYEVWRYIAPRWVCPTCRKGGMIPATSPAAQGAVNKLSLSKLRPTGYMGSRSLSMPEVEQSKDGPGHFKISGVDRETKMDTIWHCDASSEANARAKADLEGIVVTKIERV